MENMKIEIQSLSVAYVKSCTRLLLFGMFELAISMPVEVGKNHIPEIKALLPIL